MANFLDTFAGSGSIYSPYTADSGESWGKNSDSSSAYTRDGAGSLYSDNVGSEDRAVPTYTIGPDQRIRFVYRKKGTLTGTSNLIILLRIGGGTGATGPAAGTGLYWLSLITNPGGSAQADFWSHTAADAWAQLGTATSLGTLADGDIFDATVEGTGVGGDTVTLRFFRAGTAIKTEPDGAAVATSGGIGLTIKRDSATTDTQFGRIQAATLGTALNYTLTLTGGGTVGAAVTCTVTPEVFDGTPQAINGTVTVNFSGVSGVPANHVFTFSNSSAAQTFDVTPTGTGTLTASGTNDQFMVDPGNATKTILAAAVNATLSGPSPSGAVVGQASNDFTVTLDGAAPAGGVACTVTSSVAGDVITPSVPTIPAGQTTVTFSVTPSSAGNRTITLVSITGGGTISGSPITLRAVQGMYAASGQSFATGSTVGYKVDQVLNGALVNYWPRTTSGVIEDPAGSGNYVASIPLAAPGGYHVLWDDGSTYKRDEINLSAGAASVIDYTLVENAVHDARRSDHQIPGTYGEGVNVYSTGGRVEYQYDGQFAAVAGGTVTLPVSRTDGQAFGTNGEYLNKQLWINGGTGRDGTVYLTTWVSGRVYGVGPGSVAVDATSQFTIGPDTVTTAGTIDTAGSVAGDVGGNVDGSVGSVTAPVTAGTVTDKTGYGLGATGLDAIPTTDPGGVANTYPKMMVQLWRRYFKPVVKDSASGTIKTFADNGTTVRTTQTYTQVGSDESLGSAT